MSSTAATPAAVRRGSAQPEQQESGAAPRTAIVETTCCVVGAGPGGAFLALLLARQGVPTLLLEAHRDFDRDFRGDALQPAALDLIGQVSLAERLFELALARTPAFPIRTAAETLPFLEVSRLRTPYPFTAMVPQARFLALLTAEARRHPCCSLVLGARVEGLIEDGGVIRGVRYRARDGQHEAHAQLVVAADGRFSKVRGLAGLEPVRAAPPFDLLWFRLPREAADPPGGIYLGDGGWLVLLNRGAEWQVAYSLAKGGYQRLRAAGIGALRRSVGSVVPWLAGRTDALRDWHDTSLLVVEVNRLRRWYRPGLLLIGDAAHTMSPVAGVGISVALQDAAVAANVLAPQLRAGRVAVRDLAEVQRRREPSVRIVQGYQALVQRWLLATQQGTGGRIPLMLRLQARVPLLRHLTARIFGLGVRPIRVVQV